MAGKVSKNSTKGSKRTVFVKPEKIKKHKEYLLIELTKSVYEKFKAGKDVSEYIDENGNSKFVDSIIQYYGKPYLKIKNL